MEGKKQNQCLLNHQLSSETIEQRAEKVLKCSFPRKNSTGEGTASKLRLGRNCVEHLSDLLILKKKKSTQWRRVQGLSGLYDSYNPPVPTAVIPHRT